MASNNVIFEDYTIKVQGAIDSKIDSTLAAVSGELVSQVIRNFDTAGRVDTGRTKNSFQYHIDNATHTAYIGSNAENAIWEEFGTGEYALKGNGRKGGWRYKDEQGKWHHTYGKTPSRAFFNAYTGTKDKIINIIQQALKGL